MLSRRTRYQRRSNRWRIFWVLVLVLAAATVFYMVKNRNQQVNLIDPAQKLVVAGEAGWDYRQYLSADLDGDGSTETVVIMARVAKDPERPGEYQWDDGQPWQIYIQDGDNITHVYARWVQLGNLIVFITDEESARLAIAENEGAGFRLYMTKYTSNGQSKTRKLAGFSVLDRR